MFEEAAYGFYERFQHQFAAGKLETWETATYKGSYALDLSNRYLTPKKDALAIEHIPFSKVVNPHGILEDMVGKDYIHGEENKVQYYACCSEANRKKSYETIQPQTYHVGDIVEVQIFFVAVPLKGQKAKMLAILHSVALMDDSFATVSAYNIHKGDMLTEDPGCCKEESLPLSSCT